MEESKKYIDGFNSGYTLRQHAPDLARKLVDTLKEQSDYIQGIKDGTVQFEKELDIEILRFAEQHKENIKEQNPPEKDINKEKGRDYTDL